MSEVVSFQVDGLPVPKGSFSPARNGGFRPQGDQRKINAWRSDVKAAAHLAMDGAGYVDLMRGPIRLLVDFQLPAPKSIPKYKMGWLLPTKKPDIDKLIRSVCDHLTGIVWADDSQVCFLTLTKHYAWDDRPGIWCEITELEEEWVKSYGATRMSVKRVLTRLGANGE